MTKDKKKRKLCPDITSDGETTQAVITPSSSASDLRLPEENRSVRRRIQLSAACAWTVKPLTKLPVQNESLKNWDGTTKQGYPVIYQCSKCTIQYYFIVQENAWFSLQLHSCPGCKIQQIPTIDITLPQNARELDPNMKLLYHELFEVEFINLNKAGNIPLYLDKVVSVALFPTNLSNPQISTQSIPEDVFGGSRLNFRLLALIIHTKRCDGVHSTSKEHDICFNAKVLLLHAQSCPSPFCRFPYCFETKKIIYYLSYFPGLF